MKMLVIFMGVYTSLVAVLVSAAPTNPNTQKNVHSIFHNNPEEFVNVLGGTDSRHDLSHGGSLPMVVRPWGFNGYAPMTDDDSSSSGWWFHPYDRQFFGMRVTHQPSPWIKDYGNFLINAYMPPAGSGTSNVCGSYSPSKSTFSPYYFKTELLPYASPTEPTTMEFTGTRHGGIMKVTFPTFVPSSSTASNGQQLMPQQELQSSPSSAVSSTSYDYFDQTRRIIVTLNGAGSNGADHSEVGVYSEDGTAMLSGYTRANSGGVGIQANFAHYFVMLVYGGPDGRTPIKPMEITEEMMKKLQEKGMTSFIRINV